MEAAQRGANLRRLYMHADAPPVACRIPADMGNPFSRSRAAAVPPPPAAATSTAGCSPCAWWRRLKAEKQEALRLDLSKAIQECSDTIALQTCSRNDALDTLAQMWKANPNDPLLESKTREVERLNETLLRESQHHQTLSEQLSAMSGLERARAIAQLTDQGANMLEQMSGSAQVHQFERAGDRIADAYDALDRIGHAARDREPSVSSSSSSTIGANRAAATRAQTALQERIGRLLAAAPPSTLSAPNAAAAIANTTTAALASTASDAITLKSTTGTATATATTLVVPRAKYVDDVLGALPLETVENVDVERRQARRARGRAAAGGAASYGRNREAPAVVDDYGENEYADEGVPLVTLANSSAEEY